MSASSEPYKVPEALNDLNGDIILRSSDQVEFRVSRWPLQHLYPVFSDMFRLPNPSPLESSTPHTVQMDETAPVIEALLRLAYPIDPPIVKDIRTMTLITEAIVKLQAERRCRWWIRMTVENLIPVDPWALYAILLASGRKSCDYNFEDEIRIAARGTVGRPVVRPWDEARLISGADYDRLLVYHSECRNTLLGTRKELWEKAGTQWPWFDSHCSASGSIVVGKRSHWVPQWFRDFRSTVEKTLCEQLRGEAVESVDLWYDLLDRDREVKKMCSSCAKSCASQMPAYAKALSKFSEEAISQVSCSF